MVNVVNQFNNAVGVGAEHDKNYWENVKKAASALEKASIGELDKLFDTIYQRKPCEVGALVFVLGARLKKPTNDSDSAGHLIQQFEFVAGAVSHEELDHIHDKFTSVMHQFTTFLLDSELAIHGLRVLQKAITQLSKGTPGIITNLHPRLFLLCLMAKRFDPARDFLDLDAGTCFLNSQQIYRVTCENALLFFYYGGLVKLALKDFHGASLMFESCVCMPAISPSTIMLEALKKLMLLNSVLIRPQHLPNYRSPPIQRLIQSKCQKYQGIVHIFNDATETKSKNPGTTISRLEEALTKNGNELEKDKNGGLAIELLHSAVRKNVSKLPDVFSKLQLRKVSKYCRIDANLDVKHELEKFLQRDDVDGKIDEREGTICFNPVQTSSDLDQVKLDDATEVCSKLDDLLRSSHHVVDMHPTILARHLKKQNGQGLPAAVNFT